MWKKIKVALKKWYDYRYGAPFTVACDLSPFPYPGNTREWLEHVNGIAAARSFAHYWVEKHPCGQARIIKGHITWENGKLERKS